MTSADRVSSAYASIAEAAGDEMRADADMTSGAGRDSGGARSLRPRTDARTPAPDAGPNTADGGPTTGAVAGREAHAGAGFEKRERARDRRATVSRATLLRRAAAATAAIALLAIGLIVTEDDAPIPAPGAASGSGSAGTTSVVPAVQAGPGEAAPAVRPDEPVSAATEAPGVLDEGPAEGPAQEASEPGAPPGGAPSDAAAQAEISATGAAVPGTPTPETPAAGTPPSGSPPPGIPQAERSAMASAATGRGAASAERGGRSDGPDAEGGAPAAGATSAPGPDLARLPAGPESSAPGAMPAATSASPAAAAGTARVLARGYVVQLGVFADPGNAASLSRELAAQGYPAHLQSRVVLGPFPDRQAAKVAAERLRRDRKLEGIIVPPHRP